MSADRDESKAETGLETRYHVTKINDPAAKHAECRYFVLDPQHDPLARIALDAYASAAFSEGREQLGIELAAWAREAGDH